MVKKGGGTENQGGVPKNQGGEKIGQNPEKVTFPSKIPLFFRGGAVPTGGPKKGGGWGGSVLGLFGYFGYFAYFWVFLVIFY